MVAVTATATLAAGGTAWLTVRGLLLATVDADLRERANGFVRGGVPEGWLSDRMSSPMRGENDGSHLVLFDEHGVEHYRSPALGAADDIAAAVTPGGPIVALRLVDGTPLRVCAVEAPIRSRRSWRDQQHTPAHDERRVVVVLSQSTATVVSDLQRLGGVLVGLWLLAGGLAWAAAWSLRRAVLRPVARLACAINAIDPETLHPRPQVADAPHELARIVGRLDQLLGRVDTVLTREKTTISAIAHELRTPVAGLRTTLEFACARGGDAESQRTYQTCLEVVVAMQTQVETLLRLSRLEAGAEALDQESCDLVVLLRDSWNAVAERAEHRHHAITWHLPATMMVTSNREALRTIIGNAFSNAIDHAPIGSALTVGLAVTADGAASSAGEAPNSASWNLAISNPSSLEDASRVFAAYWRADPARGSGHSGLGLALSRRLAHLLGLDITATADGRTFVLVVSCATHQDLPRSQDVVSEPR